MKEKSYSWIIALVAVIVLCMSGGYVRNRYTAVSSIEGFEAVDVENADVAELIETADDGREEYIIKVNINTATAEELMSVKGIGDSTARNIIDFRNEYGDFINTREIMLVKGIGQKMYDKISKYLTISEGE